jgi:hypothetical protein
MELEVVARLPGVWLVAGCFGSVRSVEYRFPDPGLFE